MARSGHDRGGGHVLDAALVAAAEQAEVALKARPPSSASHTSHTGVHRVSVQQYHMQTNRGGELRVLRVREHPLNMKVHPLTAKSTPQNERKNL